MKKFIVHHRSFHHATSSGYGRIIDYIKDVKVISGNVGFPYRLAKQISRNTNQEAGSYDTVSVLKDLELFKELKKTRKTKNIVHYLNAERDIRNIVRRKKQYKNTCFLGTFHKPPALLKKTISNIKFLSKLDGVIAVGESQVEYLKTWLNTDNVIYIPHGVDTSFFYPDSSKKVKEPSILFVGQHLRNFDVFNQVVFELIKNIPNLVVNVVIHKAYANQVLEHDSIIIKSNIDDHELLELYQLSTLLFLPLKDVTACNSILEALSCGLPIVTSSVGSNPKYLEGSGALLLEDNDIKNYIKIISSLIYDMNSLNQIAKESREKALEYDWEIISHQINEFYLKTSLI